jgi:hypothetical protein
MLANRSNRPPSFAPEQLWQAINPWSWWASGTGQVGLININQMASSNPELEADIVQNVAGYGKQLGRLSEALAAVIANLPTDQWPDADRKALGDFKELAEQIQAHKRGQIAPTVRNVDRLVDGIRSVQPHDPDGYRQLVKALRDRLDAIDPP